MQSRTLARMQSRDLHTACWSGSRVSRLGRPPWAAWAAPRAGTSVSHQQKMPLACITTSICLSSSSCLIKVFETACISVALALQQCTGNCSTKEALISLLLPPQEMRCRAFPAEPMTLGSAPCQSQLASLPPSQGMRATCPACWSAMCWPCITLHQTLLQTSMLEVRLFSMRDTAYDLAVVSSLSVHEYCLIPWTCKSRRHAWEQTGLAESWAPLHFSATCT